MIEFSMKQIIMKNNEIVNNVLIIVSGAQIRIR